jgi:hypothetical protein
MFSRPTPHPLPSEENKNVKYKVVFIVTFIALRDFENSHRDD